MRFLSFQKTFLNIVFVVFTSKTFSQEGKTIVIQDSRFVNLLNEKRKMNESVLNNDRYKIQIFSGDSEASKKQLSEFKKNHKNTDATIIFNSPIYKVLIGNYKTRIDAERKLKDLQKKYPNAYLIKPTKY